MRDACVNGEQRRWDDKQFSHMLKTGGASEDLNVYHVNQRWCQTNRVSNDLFHIGGAFHAGVEVHQGEWSYGEDGIACDEPRSQSRHVFHESIYIGQTTLSALEVNCLIASLKREWHGEDYHLLERNCCSFADVLCQEIVGEPVPNWLTRFPELASVAVIHLDGLIDVNNVANALACGEETPSCREEETPKSMALGHQACSFGMWLPFCRR
jgi:hypothetical protein